MKSTLINTDDDRKFLATWQKLISNFVKYADPTPVVNNNVGWLKWKKAQDSRAACVYLDINLEPEEKHRMFAERMEFWNRNFFQDLLEKYAISHEEDELLDASDERSSGSRLACQLSLMPARDGLKVRIVEAV